MPFEVADDVPGEVPGSTDAVRRTRKQRIIAVCVVVDVIIIAVVLAVIFA